jgi:hypothetical protein
MFIKISDLQKDKTTERDNIKEAFRSSDFQPNEETKKLLIDIACPKARPKKQAYSHIPTNTSTLFPYNKSNNQHK